MRIGIIVDGQAEYRSLPKLLERVQTPHAVISTLYADIQPYAPVGQIVTAVRTKLPILIAKKVDRVVVLLDREDRQVCPGDWAREIEQVLSRKCAQVGIASFCVVVKEPCYESWLIGDVSAFKQMPARFSLSKGDINSIQPNKADRCDARNILKKAAKGASYSKVNDAVRIMRLVNPLRLARNSRSFRRLLRQLEHEMYKDQSKQPR
jgi:hypothetical protein